MNELAQSAIPLAHVLVLAAALFVLGLLGLLLRRSLLFTLMSLEVLLNAAALAFVAGGARWQQPDGQVMFVFILSVAGVEVSIGLALLLALARRHGRSGVVVDAVDKLGELPP